MTQTRVETARVGKPRLLDLFCGAGGCTKGYQRAGFYVVGVDSNPQPNYCGDEFIQGDALEILRWGAVSVLYEAVHASPPCQAFSLASLWHGKSNQDRHPDLVAPTRELLEAAGLPYVMENVVGAPLRADLTLCGEMFGLGVHRHRIFELDGFFAMRLPHPPHRLRSAKHNCHVEEGYTRIVAGNYADHESASEAMGVDWMSRKELAQAIPPAYTEHIGGYLMTAVQQPDAPRPKETTTHD